MDAYVVVMAGLGAVILLTAWLPLVLRRLPLSLPIFCIGIGAVVFLIPGTGIAPSPLKFGEIAERATEFVVVVSLMGAGLKLDRLLGWRNWRSTWRLLAVTMPLSIAGIAFLGWGLLGLGLPTAILLGAALAPTDPVLASDIQVGPPGSGPEGEVRFALTSEAGLNDALAFPFVNLAIALSLAASFHPMDWAMDWLLIDVVWKIGVGTLMGMAVGHSLGWLTFHLPARARIASTRDGFVAIGITFIAYGLTEMASGYGFLAVFIAALKLRDAEREHKYHEHLHDFVEQIERLGMMVLLVLFGGALTQGLLSDVAPIDVLFAVLAILLVRPLAGWIGLQGLALPRRERAVIAFFGIRGVGSAYYLTYALGEADFERPSSVWAATALVILFSVVLHGTTVSPIMRRLEKADGGRLPSEGAGTAAKPGSVD